MSSNGAHQTAGRGHRDLIVIGASAGGVPVLKHVVGQLPPDLAAAVLVVVHVPATYRSNLPHVLSRAGPLEATHAEDGETMQRGHIYIAPPDLHLVVGEDDTVRLVRGPRENHSRPAIDPLFRSAARACGRRVIAVVLSGALDDGTHGLQAVKMAGGVTIVQDPDGAAFPEMPESALRAGHVDHCVDADAIAALLVKLTQEEVAVMSGPRTHDDGLDKERHDQKRDGVFSCPDCGGVLTEVEEGNLLHYRCRVGHAFSPESLVAQQSEVVEEAMWTAVRSMEEGADTALRMASRARDRHHERRSQDYTQRAEKLQQAARVVRDLLQSGPHVIEHEDEPAPVA